MIAAEKKALRQRMSALRDACDPAERAALSACIITEIEAVMRVRKVKVLHSFLPMGSEVDLFPLLDRAVAKGIAVYAPKSLKGRVMENYRYTGQQDLVPGVFGTRHPAGDAYTGTFDLIIVPGLDFTAKATGWATAPGTTTPSCHSTRRRSPWRSASLFKWWPACP